MKYLLTSIFRIFIGVIVLAIASAINTNMANVIFFSIVCTAGIGLLFWIPLALVIGIIIHKTISVIVHKTNIWINDSKSTDEEISLKIKTLASYIEQGQQKGLSKKEIYKKLENVGWEKIYIDEAYKFIKN